MCKFLIWLMDNGFGLWSCMQHGWAFGMVVVFMDHVDGLVRLDFIGVVCGASTICFFLRRSYVLLVIMFCHVHVSFF